MASTTAKLAATYLAIIMLMSIGFSIVFYNTSSHALNRSPQGAMPNSLVTVFDNDGDEPPQRTTIREFLDNRADQGRHELVVRLLYLNVLTLLVGAGISYYLARRTLRPIEANIEAQRQFVSDASHELRTPLTAIQTSNDVALRNKKLTLADAKTVIADNTAEAVKLKQLSDGLLDLARNDGHHQALSDVPLQSVVQNALNQVVAIAQAKDIAVDDAVEDVTVNTNEQVLSQILVILLDNAVKYSDQGSTIYITSATKGGQATINVRDEGVGIRASDIPHLFRRFYRADNARNSSHEHGYGLGLAIADSLATAHGASLSVSSELHKGSTFSVKLPLSKLNNRD